jgi:HlyD family secretion protein
MRRIAAAAIGALIIAAVAWWAWPSGSDAGSDASFATEAVDRGDITQVVSAVGSVRALNSVEVGSQLSGQLQALFVDYNSQVKVGDLLARIDPQTFERRVQEAEANLAVARANIEIQAATIQRADANLKAAERDYERQKSLVERGSVSESALDAAEAAWQSARAEAAIARAQHQNARATVQQREAALEAAQIDLERTEIRSPIDGVVIDRAVDVGQTVAASLQAPVLFTIAQDLAQIQIEASVDEADIGSVREGATAKFGVDAFPDREFQGEVAQVRLAPNEEGNVVTYTVVIGAANPGRRLLPGMTANIDIVTGRREDVLRVANAAVRFRLPGAEGPTPGAPGGANPGAELAETLTELGIDEARRQQIATDMRQAFGSIGGLFASGADRDQIRARIEGLRDEVLARHLDPDELERFAALQRERATTRPATIYVLSKGIAEPRAVRLGISDDRYTEIAAGALAEGDPAITRQSAGAGR